MKIIAISLFAGLTLALSTSAATVPAPDASPVLCSAAEGQRLINEGRYEKAIREFTCLIASNPTEVEGYRGRIEAEVLLGRYADAVHDYTRITALVMPIHPDAQQTILAGYNDRLAATPDNLPALKGASFARWWFFDYLQAIHLLNHLLDLEPNDAYANLFRGSSRLLKGVNVSRGEADLNRGLQLAPQNPSAHFIAADAYTYGLPVPERAFAEASLAMDLGLNTPRIQAILADAYLAFGDELSAAFHTQIHFEMVTTELIPTTPLEAGNSMALDLVPGRTFEIPLPVIAGQTVSITTGSHDFWDSIALLLAPSGSPVLARDDVNAYFAAIDWVAPQTGTYRLQVTSFESVSTGELTVTRK